MRARSGRALPAADGKDVSRGSASSRPRHPYLVTLGTKDLASAGARLELRPQPRPSPGSAGRGADWDALEPRGLYARTVRGPFLYAAALALVALALPLALAIALVNALVHRSARAVLFTQRRVGRRGRIFVLYKFRSMREPRAGLDDRARVTRFGRLLRNTHLDELPQLWNVLRGEMALIGPRPEQVATERWAAEHLPGFSERLVLAPGITGLAQITQGYAQDGDEPAYARKLELNRRYFAELSFGLDCAILARTALWMLRGRGWRRPPTGAG